MPTPRENETRSDFVNRCIPVVKGESDTKSTEHAIAKCHGIWNQSKKRGAEDVE